jgi:hypothetical protein
LAVICSSSLFICVVLLLGPPLGKVSALDAASVTMSEQDSTTTELISHETPVLTGSVVSRASAMQVFSEQDHSLLVTGQLAQPQSLSVTHAVWTETIHSSATPVVTELVTSLATPVVTESVFPSATPVVTESVTSSATPVVTKSVTSSATQ